MKSTAQSPQHATHPLPWSVAALVLAALTSLYFTADRHAEPLIAGLVLILAQLVPARLPRSRSLAAALRLTLFTLIVIHIGFPDEPFPQWYMKPAYTNLIGCVLAAEAALRACERTDAALVGDPRGVMIFLSALIMAAACNTSEKKDIQVLAPTYAGLLVLSLLSFSGGQKRLWRFTVLRFVLLAAVIFGGSRVVSSVSKYDQELNTLAARFLPGRRGPVAVGLSQAPRLNSLYNPLQDMDRVLVMDGVLDSQYMAVMEFDTYVGREWSPALPDRQFTSADPRELRNNQAGPRIEVTRIGETFDMLAMPLQTGSVESLAGVERDGFGALRHTETGLTGNNSRYTIVVPKDVRYQGPTVTPVSGDQRAKALALPMNFSPKAVDAARVSAGAGDEASKVFRLSAYLQRHHGYDLRYFAPAGEVISDFILNERPAHCAYFASALVMMCRSVGIPARLVTGFYAHEKFGSNSLVVRERDAHAWTECWLEGVGWVGFDATPAGGRPDALVPETSGLRKIWEHISDVPDHVRQWISQFSQSTFITILVVLAAMCFIVFGVSVLLYRRRARLTARKDAYASADPKIAALATRFERWLARSGGQCPPEKTWRQCAAGQEALRDRFVDAYDAVRFGSTTPQRIELAQELLKQLENSAVSPNGPSSIS